MEAALSRRVVLGLGANLGDRLESLSRAAAAIAALPDVTVVRASPVYESRALGGEQPDYLNAALLVETTLSLDSLLDRVLAIEASLGRVRRERWGPRTIDIDILFSDGPPRESAHLTVPHPHLHERAFALAPLLDVLPDAPPRYHEHLRDLGGPPSVFATTLEVRPK
jgi:2-amino-4-hydroxy-6-hydroxymethyldihydropteridine diphosphokinase